MRRALPLAVVLLAALAIVLLVTRGGGGTGVGGALDRPEEGYVPPPALEGAPRSRSDPRRPGRDDVAVETPRTGPDATPGDEAPVVVRGTVVAAESGQPLAGAWVWFEPAADPCPRLSWVDPADAGTGAVEAGARRPPPASERAHTDASGAFTLHDALHDAPAVVDVFAVAEGRVLGVRCRVERPGPVELRLERGLELSGRVVTAERRPLRDARVSVRPAPDTLQVPGHATSLPAAPTDESGHFVVGGLRPGALLVDVDHPRYMPATAGPVDPANADPMEIVLVPALRATFRLTTDDGKRPEHPTLVWSRTAKPEETHALLLVPRAASSDEGGALDLAGVITSEAVRLPSGVSPLALTVQADGYAPWQSGVVSPPPEGGEKTFEVELRSSLGTGSVRISFEDESGNKVNAAAAAVALQLSTRQPTAGGSAFVVQPGEDLSVTALPAGAYHARLTSAKFAPVETDLTVFAGEETATTLRTRPPAQVRVQFVAPEPRVVVFQLTQGGQVVHAIPVGATSTSVDEATGQPILAAGPEGLLLSGLAAGTYVIEVTSDDLVASPTTVRLSEGDTEEVEISVSLR